MTCIVGIVTQRGVVIGGDSAGVSSNTVTSRADEKVFVNGPFTMGFTSSFRMGQLLRYKFEPPKHPYGMDNVTFMSTEFIDAVRKCLEDGGFMRKHNSAESGGCFLVGYNGELYQIDSDFQVAKNRCGYDAIGCGAEIALGALYANEKKRPLNRALVALRAAEEFCHGVRGPFVIIKECGNSVELL